MKFPPFRFVYDIYFSHYTITQQENLSNELLSKEDDWQPSIPRMHSKNHPLIIGESVRRDYMSLYNSEFDNTPFLNRTAGIVFDNYYSASSSTVISLTHPFYLKEEENIGYIHSVIRLAKKAGFKTFWLSNQGRFGTHDGPVAQAGKEADYSHFIKCGNTMDSAFFPNTALIPEIKRALSDPADKKLIVVFMIGSHPDPCVRTMEAYDYFHVSQNIPCYLQSIKNTDHLLKEIRDLAISHQDKWSMMYFADHGLVHLNREANNAILEHGFFHKQAYQPPFFVTSSDFRKRVRILPARTGMDFIPMLPSWLVIEDLRIDNSCDYFFDQQCYSEIMVIDSNLIPIDVNSLQKDAALQRCQ